ncbi:hypothetical protein MYX82_01210 [Acidobacteria bacterium AH-259-D05]|nr:hypothetical protein [Acidobacteria bacterium AH-259-D05]
MAIRRKLYLYICSVIGRLLGLREEAKKLLELEAEKEMPSQKSNRGILSQPTAKTMFRRKREKDEKRVPRAPEFNEAMQEAVGAYLSGSPYKQWVEAYNSMSPGEKEKHLEELHSLVLELQGPGGP